MTRVKIFKNPKFFAKFSIGLGIVILVLGIISSFKFMTGEFNSEFPSADWNALFYVIQGVLWISFGTYTLRNRKYFIEWDDNQLRFLIPGYKTVVTLDLSDVESVEVKLFEIILHLPNRTQKFDLNGLDYEDLKKIKAKFESFKKVA